MTRRTMRLGHDELWHLFTLVDAATLTGRNTEAPCRVVLARGQELVVDDPRLDVRCLLPAAGLRQLRTAAMVVLAARTLLAPGVVTAAVVGTNPVVNPPMLARHVPGVSHLAVCPAGRTAAGADVLDLAGIGLLATAAVGEAVRGANLVVLAGRECPRRDELAPGAVLVNASGRDLPSRLVRGVDGIYVDDLELLPANTHRELVRTHLAGTDASDDPMWRAEGWHRGRAPSARPRVDADLGQVLAGRHPGRRLPDEVLLVELLGTRELDVELACQVSRIALEHGLGTTLSEE